MRRPLTLTLALAFALTTGLAGTAKPNGVSEKKSARAVTAEVKKSAPAVKQSRAIAASAKKAVATRPAAVQKKTALSRPSHRLEVKTTPTYVQSDVVDSKGGVESKVAQEESDGLDVPAVVEPNLPRSIYTGGVVINEIMYDSKGSTDQEWAELYNSTTSDVDISDWIITDASAWPSTSEGAAKIPAGTTLAAGAVVAVAFNASGFSELEGEIAAAAAGGTAGATFPALGNSGDNVALVDASNALVDGSFTLNFPDFSPGNIGITIERNDANGDFGIANYWHTSGSTYNAAGAEHIYCTPGTANSTGPSSPIAVPFTLDGSSYTWMPGWVATSGHWQLYATAGNPAPTLEFYYSPVVTNYVSTLTSPAFDGSSATYGVNLSYDLYLSNYSTATVEELTIQVSDGVGGWVTLLTHSNQAGSIAWTPFTHDISAYTAGTFQIRAMATGANSNNINYWYFDNIKLEARAATPTLSVSNDKLIFPATLVGGSATASLTLSNSGAGDLSGTITYPDGITGDASFSGNSATVTITYTPTASGLLSGDISIASNGGDATVAVEGNAGAVAHTFETEWPAGWTAVNNDGDSYAWSWYTGANYHTGANYAGVHWNSAGNDDWLISPKLEVAAGDHFTFFARSRSSTYGLEDMNIMLSSTGGTDIADFDVTLANVVDVPVAYTAYDFDLSGYAGTNVAVAIQCVSVDIYYLYVDDIATSIAAPCYDDAYEDNDTDSTATVVGAGSYALHSCPADNDWFYFETTETNQIVTVSTSSSVEGFDVDLYLFDLYGNVVDYSAGADANESAEALLADAGPTWIYVENWAGEGDYTLDVSAVGVCDNYADANEPNDVMSAATGLTANAGYSSAAICPADDQDYYSFVLEEGAWNVCVDLASWDGNPYGTDTELELYDSSGTSIGFNDDGYDCDDDSYSFQSTIIANGLGGGTYYVRADNSAEWDPTGIFGYNIGVFSAVNLDAWAPVNLTATPGDGMVTLAWEAPNPKTGGEADSREVKEARKGEAQKKLAATARRESVRKQVAKLGELPKPMMALTGKKIRGSVEQARESGRAPQGRDCTEDSYEDNDGMDAAPELIPGTYSLGLCLTDVNAFGYTQDWFSATVNAGETITVSVGWADNAIDVDLYLGALEIDSVNFLDYSWFDNPEVVTATNTLDHQTEFIFMADLYSGGDTDYSLTLGIEGGTGGQDGLTCATAWTAAAGYMANSATGDDEWFSYTATMDGTITISSQNTEGNALWDTYLFVYSDCEGTLVGYNDDCCGYWGPSIVEIAATAGATYSIFWDGRWSPGPFTWSLEESSAGICDAFPDPYEPNDEMAAATGVMSGSYLTAAICPVEESDWFTTFIEADGVLEIQTFQVSGDEWSTDTNLELYDASGNLVADDDDSGPGYTSYIFESLDAGSYYIHVFSLWGFVGDYALGVTFTEEPEEMSYNVYSSDGWLVQWGYTNTTLEVTGLTNGTEYCFYATTNIPGVGESGPSNTACAMPDVTCESLADANEPNDDAASATPVATDGSSVSATICPTNDVDYYSFTLGDGWWNLCIDISSVDGDPYGTDTYVELYDADGNLVASNDDGYECDWSAWTYQSTIVYDGLVGGSYTVLVDQSYWSSTSVFAYGISVAAEAGYDPMSPKNLTATPGDGAVSLYWNAPVGKRGGQVDHPSKEAKAAAIEKTREKKTASQARNLKHSSPSTIGRAVAGMKKNAVRLPAEVAKADDGDEIATTCEDWNDGWSYLWYGTPTSGFSSIFPFEPGTYETETVTFADYAGAYFGIQSDGFVSVDLADAAGVTISNITSGTVTTPGPGGFFATMPATGNFFTIDSATPFVKVSVFSTTDLGGGNYAPLALSEDGASTDGFCGMDSAGVFTSVGYDWDIELCIVSSEDPCAAFPDTFEPNDEMASSYALDTGGNFYLTAGICPVDESDWFAVTLPDDGTLDLQTYPVSGDEWWTDTNLDLYDALGNLLASDDDGGPGYTSYISSWLQPGTYYVRVYSIWGFEGDYGLGGSFISPLTYNVYFSDGTLIAGGFEETYYEATDLDNFTEYCFFATTNGPDGESGPSQVACATPLPYLPPATDLYATAGNQKVDLTWAEPYPTGEIQRDDGTIVDWVAFSNGGGALSINLEVPDTSGTYYLDGLGFYGYPMAEGAVIENAAASPGNAAGTGPNLASAFSSSGQMTTTYGWNFVEAGGILLEDDVFWFTVELADDPNFATYMAAAGAELGYSYFSVNMNTWINATPYGWCWMMRAYLSDSNGKRFVVTTEGANVEPGLELLSINLPAEKGKPAMPNGKVGSVMHRGFHVPRVVVDGSRGFFDGTYSVYRSDDYGSTSFLLASGVEAEAYTDETVANYSTYCYYVEAVYGEGAISAPSNWVCAMPYAIIAEYSSDFEADDGGMQPTLNGEWEWGTPTSGPAAGHGVWATDLDSTYEDYAYDWLAMRDGVNLSGLQNPVVGASILYSLENGWDFGYGLVDPYGNGSWYAIAEFTGTNESYPNFDSGYGHLTDFAWSTNARFAFLLSSDGSVVDDGIYVDELYVGAGPHVTASVDAMADSMAESESATHTFTLSNTGALGTDWFAWVEFSGGENVIAYEDFDSGSLNTFTGDGWSVGDAATASSEYMTYPDHGLFAYINDDAAGSGAPAAEVYLMSPMLYVMPGEDVSLEMDLFFPQFDEDCGASAYSDHAEVGVLLDGSTWQLIDGYPVTGGDWASEEYDITGAVSGATTFNVVVYYSDCGGSWGYGIGVDHVKVVQGHMVEWLTLEPTYGSLNAGDSQDVVATMNSTGMPLGDHYSTIWIGGQFGSMQIPVTLTVTGVGVAGEKPVPQSFALHQNFPNPFNPVTAVPFDVPEASDVTIEIYNLLGQRIRTLVSGLYQPGYHKATWNGRNEAGDPVTTGVYIYRITAKNQATGNVAFTQTRKLVMVK